MTCQSKTVLYGTVMETQIEQRPAGRREVRKQERRATILTVARQSFVEDGYAATTMSGLAETLGGSKATLWSYFRSKEDLFAAVIDDFGQGFRQQIAGDLLAEAGVRETLEQFSRDFLDRIANPDAIAIWRLVVSESGRFPELGRIFYDNAARHVERALADYILRQIDLGVLRDEGAVKMAQFLISLCVSQQTKLLFGVACDARDVTAAEFATHFLRLFGR